MKYIGIDIGGTQIKYGIINEMGEVLEYYQMPTEAEMGRNHLLGKISFIIDNLSLQNKIAGIGISTAGQVNSTEGVIKFATESIPQWTGTKLQEYVENTFGLPCKVENDVNCAALGEAWKGAAREEKNFLCLTLGTGIGGAIVIDGRIFSGSSFSAGEVGHMKIGEKGILCTCGAKDCYEVYASTKALVKRMRNVAKDDTLNGQEIFDRYKKNEELFVDEVDKWIDYVTDGLRNLVVVFNPSLIVIGGGVTEQKDFLLDKFKASIKGKVMSSFQENLKIKFASCGNQAGMLGAVYNLLNS